MTYQEPAPSTLGDLRRIVAALEAEPDDLPLKIYYDADCAYSDNIELREIQHTPRRVAVLNID